MTCSSLNCPLFFALVLVIFVLVVNFLGLVDPLVVALGQGVDDGEDEVGDHQQHKLLEDPTQNVAVL